MKAGLQTRHHLEDRAHHQELKFASLAVRSSEMF